MAKEAQVFVYDDKALKKITADGQAIGQMIKGIVRSNKTLQTNIAICAASIVCHAVIHGNVTPATQLCDALTGGWRTNALRDWFIKFGPFVWVKDEAGKSAFKLDKDKREAFKKVYDKNKMDFAKGLMDEPFWVYKPEPEYQGFNLPEQLMQLLARADRVLNSKDESKRNNEKNDFTGLKELKTTLALIKSQMKENEQEEAEVDDNEIVTEIEIKEKEAA